MKFYRNTLTANTEEVVPINSQNITILNVGPNDLYINFDGEASTDSLLIPPSVGRSFYFDYIVKKVHVISDAETFVQIDGMR